MAVPGRLHSAVASGALIAGLVAGPPVPVSAPGTQLTGVRLTSGADGSTALGAGVALVMGPSLISTPSQQYVNTVDKLFLAPHGFTGTAVALTTPESPYNLAQSEAQGAQILAAAVEGQVAGGQVDAANPVVVFGYSQSSAFVSAAMEDLHAKGVPSDYVHFVLIGDPNNPNGGWLTSLTPPGTDTTLPGLQIPLGNATPDNLYPTDVYTLEYDGYADHPHYPLNLLALVNSYLGLLTEHTTYLGLTPDQVASAVELPTTGDTLTDYYVIPSDTLPLLDPLRLIPVLGQPLYDLLEPGMRVLVNMGYGSITEGWNQGPANTPTMDALFHLYPPDVHLTDFLAAVSGAASTGWSDFVADLMSPATYQIPTLEDSPFLAPIVAAAYGAGIIPGPSISSVADLVSAFLAATSGSLTNGAAAEPVLPLGLDVGV